MLSCLQISDKMVAHEKGKVLASQDKQKQKWLFLLVIVNDITSVDVKKIRLKGRKVEKHIIYNRF